jgi:hypothetical protein
MTPAQVESQLGGTIKIVAYDAKAPNAFKGEIPNLGKAEVKAPAVVAKQSGEVKGVQFGS